MKITLRTATLLLAGSLILPAWAVAQDTTPTTTGKPAGVGARQRRQQRRIGEGVENGQLTAAEAARLERREARLNREKNRMKSDGTLSAEEKARLERQENRLSKDIHHQKHDAQTPGTPHGKVEKRDAEQQKRIGEGVENGSLTSKEAARLESKEAKLQREERAMRQANGGTLTPAEKAKVNRQQNHLSKSIAKQKHDGQRRH